MFCNKLELFSWIHVFEGTLIFHTITISQKQILKTLKIKTASMVHCNTVSRFRVFQMSLASTLCMLSTTRKIKMSMRNK